MESAISASIFWHDYETFGANPQKDRPSQFAGIRTDLDLNIISEPVTLYCQPAPDYLPHPMAALVTGITPQKAQQAGVEEAAFFSTIEAEFARPETTVAGYNNLRFDDEVTRYGFYRNFIDPYAREWQNGNSRFDLIDLVRACYALRPEGIEWPLNDEGLPSFRLELLTAANGIAHETAHDAMSDVYATIALAKLIKEKQPKLWDFYFNLRFKKHAGELIDCHNLTPLVHTSSKIPSSQGCTSWIVPLGFHPTNKNAVICYNLMQDPSALNGLSADDIRERLYTKRDELGDVPPVGLKLVHLNKGPFIAPAKTLLPENAARLGIDRTACLNHLATLKADPELRAKLLAVYQTERDFAGSDNPEHQLYQGFMSDSDRKLAQQVRNTSPEQLAVTPFEFSDAKYNTLLFRYRARNWPHTLSAQELEAWRQHCRDTIEQGKGSPALDAQGFMLELENLVHEHEQDEHKMRILKALYMYAQNL